MLRSNGRRDEAEVEPGREVVFGLDRRVVAFQIPSYIRPRVDAAILQLLRVQLQGNQLDAVADDVGDPLTVGADWGRPECRWDRLAFHFLARPRVPHLRGNAPP